MTAALLDHPALARRAFYPRGTDAVPNFRVETDGVTLGCHVRRVDPAAGWVVYFHGNGELAAECDEYNSGLFTAAGVNVCFAEYRGYGTSGGDPRLAAMLPDGERVVAALGVPADRVVAFGRSLGSLYAIELARRLPKLAGLVVESGIAVLSEQWPMAREAAEIGCSPEDIAAAMAVHFDHRAKLAGYAGPLLVMHAAGDRLVLPSHGDRLHEWGGGPDKKLLLFPHGDHNSILRANLAAYTGEVREFLGRAGIVPG